MYTATMHYRFKPDSFEQACTLWSTHVIDAAKNQPGFVRMQFLEASPEALAIGTWKSKADAEAFMQTGVFVNLMADLDRLVDGKPKPQIWNLRYFAQA